MDVPTTRSEVRPLRRRPQSLIPLLLALQLTAGASTPGAEAVSPRKSLAAQAALLARCEIDRARLMPLGLETPLVAGGKARAVICHADDPAWRAAALIVQKAVADATGVELEVLTDRQLSAARFAAENVVLLGHLDNHRWVARLYHQFYVCLDTGFTGRTGYELRSVHNPLGTGHNDLLCGGSFAEGTRRAAQRLAALARQQGKPGELTLGRLLELKFDAQDRLEPEHTPLTDKQRDELIASGRRLMFSPGQGRSGVAALMEHGAAFQRTGDPREGEVYRAMMVALQEYYRTDAYINGDGMARYDSDFRDAWTHDVAILWDLHEESGLFSDQQRLEFTNLLVRLAWECILYQGWDTPASVKHWDENRTIAHNHQTFPALGLYFVGTYMKRHYGVAYVDDWLTVARGVFQAQRHSSKPQEDAAGYQWLPTLHTMIYGLATDDLTFFTEGHARETARAALMALDCAGYQASYGDSSALTSAAGIGITLQMAGWYYKDPGWLWAARLAGRDHWFPLAQSYSAAIAPRPPQEHVGVSVLPIAPLAYDFLKQKARYGDVPNLPRETAFDKLTFRGGWEPADEYLLLDGYGRGNHMHFDVQAIISYAAGGVPLLVDAEYIKNMPKYHNSLVILRDGQAQRAPVVAGLGRAEWLDGLGYARTWVDDYNGARWTRTLVWRRGDYLLVSDEVRINNPGDFTLRCCWRPWGKATLDGPTLCVQHPPMQLVLRNLDGAPARLETMRMEGDLPISCLSQQVGRAMRPGDSYRFLNVIQAVPQKSSRPLDVQRLGEGLVSIDCGGRRDLLAIGSTAAVALGLKADVEMALSSAGHLTLADASGLHSSDASVTAPARQGVSETMRAKAAASVPRLRRTWQHAGLPPLTERLPVAAVSSTAPHSGRYGPIEKLVDGRFGGSVDSVMWKAGVSPVVTFELDARAKIVSIVLREWHFGAGNEIGLRQVELSNDHFAKDIRRVAGEFRFAGREAFGGNVNTLMELPVNQEAQQVRLTLRPTEKKNAVYLAEAELRGAAAGARPPLTAWCTGNLTGAGAPEVVIAGAGLIRALSADGKLLWEQASEDRSAVNALAAIDLDGDGKAEVVYGDAGGRLTVLAPDGRKRWAAELPKYRGTTSDVRTIFPADVNGDGRPEIACGCASWQYFAFDAAGKMLWKNVIYAHSATVGTAADFDGQRRQSVVAGNAYYQLNLIGPDGKRRFSGGNLGPEMTAVAAAQLRDDPRPEIAVGVDSGDLHCFTREGQERWRINLGDRVTAIVPLTRPGDPTATLLCAAESGHVFAVKGDGSLLWRCALGDGSGGIAALAAGRLAAAAGVRGLLVVDASGRIVAQGPTAARALAVLAVGSQVVAITAAGGLEAFALEPADHN